MRLAKQEERLGSVLTKWSDRGELLTHIYTSANTHTLTPDRARGGPAAPGPQHLLSGIMHVSFQMLPLFLKWSGDLPVMQRPQIMR